VAAFQLLEIYFTIAVHGMTHNYVTTDQLNGIITALCIGIKPDS